MKKPRRPLTLTQTKVFVKHNSNNNEGRRTSDTVLCTVVHLSTMASCFGLKHVPNNGRYKDGRFADTADRRHKGIMPKLNNSIASIFIS